MTPDAVIAFVAALLSGSVGIGVLCKEPQPIVSRAFALGMLTLALREVLVGLGAQASLRLDVLRWQRLSWIVTVLLPGSWLLFSLSFARSNARELVAKWKWGVVSTLALPCIIVTFFWHALFSAPARVDEGILPLLRFSWEGYALCIFSLVVAVIVLVNLEGILRASAGTKRWQIK